MPVVLTSGDIFESGAPRALAHGCNCAGAMRKGIAKDFKQRWPKMFEEYRRRCTAGEFDLGDVFVWEENGWTIFNLATQKSWRTKANLNAIEESLWRLLNSAGKMNIQQIDLPRIGAGLGGLEWQLVREAIEKVAASSPITLRVFETFEPRNKADGETNV